MKIAQISPLCESVPPKYYGGTERIVSYLTEELASLGHEVTLFASGNSITKAKLEKQCQNSLRLDQNSLDQLALHILMIEKVAKQAEEFDIIHWHIDYLPFSLQRKIETACLNTLHGRLDIPELLPIYQEFNDIPLISISEAQRQPLPFANWLGTVYHGLPEDLYTYKDKPGEYLAFLGRISPEKRVDYAIEIAKCSGTPLKIAAKVDKADQEYFETVIKPLLATAGPDIEYIGEIGEEDKNEFLGNALAFLFPIDWPEPFGLVMIEALACGTPVIARRCGSVPEIIEDGKNGFVIDTIEEAVAAVNQISKIDRRACRQGFAEKFTANKMATNYLKIYQSLLKSRAI